MSYSDAIDDKTVDLQPFNLVEDDDEDSLIMDLLEEKAFPSSPSTDANCAEDVDIVEDLEELDEVIEDKETKILPNIIDEKNEPTLSTFNPVDRNEEDCLVAEYQKTKDEKVFHRLYEMRVQTIKIWAKKNHYLSMSEEDLRQDLFGVWAKCVHQYQYDPQARAVRTKSGKFVHYENGEVKMVFKRTPFNTFLFTSIKHYLSNTNKRKYSKKRLSRSGKPLENNLISIDCEYGVSGKDQSKRVKLRDMLSSNCSSTYEKASIDSLIDDISRGDNDIKASLYKFIEDNHTRKISGACQNIVGNLVVAGDDVAIMCGHKSTAKKRLMEIIIQSQKYDSGFKVIDFHFDKKSGNVMFEIKKKDTMVLRKTLRALERYKKRIDYGVASR